MSHSSPPPRHSEAIGAPSSASAGVASSRSSVVGVDAGGKSTSIGVVGGSKKRRMTTAPAEPAAPPRDDRTGRTNNTQQTTHIEHNMSAPAAVPSAILAPLPLPLLPHLTAQAAAPIAAAPAASRRRVRFVDSTPSPSLRSRANSVDPDAAEMIATAAASHATSAAATAAAAAVPSSLLGFSAPEVIETEASISRVSSTTSISEYDDPTADPSPPARGRDDTTSPENPHPTFIRQPPIATVAAAPNTAGVPFNHTAAWSNGPFRSLYSATMVNMPPPATVGSSAAAGKQVSYVHDPASAISTPSSQAVASDHLFSSAGGGGDDGHAMPSSPISPGSLQPPPAPQQLHHSRTPSPSTIVSFSSRVKGSSVLFAPARGKPPSGPDMRSGMQGHGGAPAVSPIDFSHHVVHNNAGYEQQSVGSFALPPSAVGDRLRSASMDQQRSRAMSHSSASSSAGEFGSRQSSGDGLTSISIGGVIVHPNPSLDQIGLSPVTPPSCSSSSSAAAAASYHSAFGARERELKSNGAGSERMNAAHGPMSSTLPSSLASRELSALRHSDAGVGFDMASTRAEGVTRFDDLLAADVEPPERIRNGSDLDYEDGDVPVAVDIDDLPESASSYHYRRGGPSSAGSIGAEPLTPTSPIDQDRPSVSNLPLYTRTLRIFLIGIGVVRYLSNEKASSSSMASSTSTLRYGPNSGGGGSFPRRRRNGAVCRHLDSLRTQFAKVRSYLYPLLVSLFIFANVFFVTVSNNISLSENPSTRSYGNWVQLASDFCMNTAPLLSWAGAFYFIGWDDGRAFSVFFEQLSNLEMYNRKVLRNYLIGSCVAGLFLMATTNLTDFNSYDTEGAVETNGASSSGSFFTLVNVGLFVLLNYLITTFVICALASLICIFHYYSLTIFKEQLYSQGISVQEAIKEHIVLLRIQQESAKYLQFIVFPPLAAYVTGGLLAAYNMLSTGVYTKLQSLSFQLILAFVTLMIPLASGAQITSVCGDLARLATNLDLTNNLVERTALIQQLVLLPGNAFQIFGTTISFALLAKLGYVILAAIVVVARGASIYTPSSTTGSKL